MPVNLPDPAGPCLQLRTQQNADAAFVKCYGRLTRDVIEILIAEVKPLIPLRKRIVLDFTEIAYMDSSGIGTVVRLYVSASNAGCELRLINFNRRVRELLGVTHVLSALETCGQFMVKMP